jgi:hypothetical protein
MSREELDRTTPVSPPNVKRKIKPLTHQIGAELVEDVPYMVLSQLNTLIPVGIAIIIVAAVK